MADDPIRIHGGEHASSVDVAIELLVGVLGDYLEGTLPEAERARVDAHLAECDRCSGYLEDMRRLVGSLREAPEPPPDPETRDALLRAFRDLRGDT